VVTATVMVVVKERATAASEGRNDGGVKRE
jgi:hypothetical protein